jgi:hypothetical protein
MAGRSYGLGNAQRLGLRRAPGRTPVTPDFERQQRPVRVADIDALTVMEVDHRHAMAVGVRAVQRIVVDRQPVALIETQ